MSSNWGSPGQCIVLRVNDPGTGAVVTVRPKLNNLWLYSTMQH